MQLSFLKMVGNHSESDNNNNNNFTALVDTSFAILQGLTHGSPVAVAAILAQALGTCNNNNNNTNNLAEKIFKTMQQISLAQAKQQQQITSKSHFGTGHLYVVTLLQSGTA
jgi:hypothetical protein